MIYKIKGMMNEWVETLQLHCHSHFCFQIVPRLTDTSPMIVFFFRKHEACITDNRIFFFVSSSRVVLISNAKYCKKRIGRKFS